MAIELFGLKIGKPEKQSATIVTPAGQDGATEIVDYGGIYFDGYNDILKNIETEKDLILAYRCLSHSPEVDQALTEIYGDAIVFSKTIQYPVKLNLDDLEVSEPIKQKIMDSFETIMEKLKFDRYGDKLFRDWYIDGRLPIYIHVDSKKQTKGIDKLIYIDPLKIQKVREVKKEVGRDNVERVVLVKEYYVYSPNEGMPCEFANMSIDRYNVGGVTSKGILLSPDSVVYATSELLCENKKMIISYLHKAIKPANQLDQLEDSTVIYRLSRAPERRVFYVDVGTLPKQKAEAYLSSLMAKFRNKLSYDSGSGKVKNQTHQKSILEDFWLPRREGGKGTEISTLGGGEGFQGIIDENEYFKTKLYKSLNIPPGRIDTENTFVFGNSGEISREEVKFSKFIDNLRNTFGHGLFDQLLATQLVITKVMTMSEYDKIKDSIFYQWNEDSHFSEMKDLEVTQKRLEVLDLMAEWTDIYYSKAWVRKHILFQTEDEIKQLRKEREIEEKTEPEMPDDEDGGFAPQAPPSAAPAKKESGADKDVKQSEDEEEETPEEKKVRLKKELERKQREENQ